MSVWYYSTGGRQNGPVPQEELVRLLATGSVAPQDLVWCEGMKDWQPAGEVPELMPTPASPVAPPPIPPPGAGAAAPLNPYQAPSVGWVEPARAPIDFGDEIVPGSQPLLVGPILSRAWELTKRHFGLIIAVGFTYIVLSAVVGGVFEVATLPFVEGRTRSGAAILSGPGHVVQILGTIVSHVFDIFLSLGLARIGLNLVSGKPADFVMLFGESRKLVDAVVGYILFMLMFAVGILLLVVPGIYVLLRFGQYQNAIIDKDMNAIEALKYSARITEGNKWNLLGLWLICGLICLGGALALLVGLIVAVPVVSIASYIAYRWLQYGQAAVHDQAPRLP